MKSILLSIRPELAAKILNREKTIEIRKQFPKDYVGWAYIYCTKDSKYALTDDRKTKGIKRFLCLSKKDFKKCSINNLNDKVVARFWCDKVEEMYYCDEEYLKLSCLSIHKMFDYLKDKCGYAIHISKLEVFDKPRELSDFHKIVNIKKCDTRYCDDYYTCNKCIRSKLTKAPQNYCYVEGEQK